MSGQEGSSYRFGPLERRGLLGPVRTGQAGILLCGAVLCVTAIDLFPSLGGATAAAGLACVSVLMAAIPVAGRGGEEWVPVVIAFLVRGIGPIRVARGIGAIRVARGVRPSRDLSPSQSITHPGRSRAGRRFLSPAPRAGMRWSLARRTLTDPPESPPDTVGRVTLGEIPYQGRDVGVVSERRGRRLTAVLACRAGSFALLDSAAQERRLSRWGLVLASAADTAVRRIQWIERTSPARADELAHWLHQARDPDTPLRGTPMVESYLELISGSARTAQAHEILVAVQVDATRLRDRSQPGLEQSLLEQSERVARGLESAEISVLGALSRGQIARALRTAFDPFSGAEMAALEALDPSRSERNPVNAWPLGAQEHWDHYVCDGALHATYWIGGWPRVDVSPMFMDALLGSSDVVRTVSVTFEPIPPTRSTREVEAAVTRDRADRELRLRFGQGETARQRQAQEAAMRREAELAAGHAEVRLAGFVTASARDEEELRKSCAQVLEHGARARLELHRLYGQQAAAFTFTLPLARGLR